MERKEKVSPGIERVSNLETEMKQNDNRRETKIGEVEDEEAKQEEPEPSTSAQPARILRLPPRIQSTGLFSTSGRKRYVTNQTNSRILGTNSRTNSGQQAPSTSEEYSHPPSKKFRERNLIMYTPNVNQRTTHGRPPPPPPSIPYQSKKQGPRNMSCSHSSITEAAKLNGIQTVAHTSGAKFAVPLTMQAHPIKLTDRIPDEKTDILNQTTPLPYCYICHAVVKTWQGYEYHVLKEHLKYRPYRCVHCPKENFYTEEEGRFHTCTNHPECHLSLVKDFDPVKEEEGVELFSSLLMMMRDGPLLTCELIHELQTKAARDVMRFHWLKFKSPLIVVRASTNNEKYTQTPLPTPHNATTYQQRQPHYAPIRSYTVQNSDYFVRQQQNRDLANFDTVRRRTELYLQHNTRK